MSICIQDHSKRIHLKVFKSGRSPPISSLPFIIISIFLNRSQRLIASKENCRVCFCFLLLPTDPSHSLEEAPRIYPLILIMLLSSPDSWFLPPVECQEHPIAQPRNRLMQLRTIFPVKQCFITDNCHHLVSSKEHEFLYVTMNVCVSE